MRLLRPLGVFLVVGAALLAMPTVAQAVTCGQVIESSTTVTNDLIDCPGDGLRIGAQGITLDLNGHTIDGDGSDGGGGDQDVGIVNGFSANGGDRPAFDGVTVVNGTVRDFEVGVSWNAPGGVPAVTDGSITGLSLDGGGVRLFFADDNRVEQNVLTRGAAIELDMSSRNRVAHNRVTGGHISIGQSFRGAGIADNLIAVNTVSDAPGDGIIFEEVGFEEFPVGNRIANNTVRRSALDGINAPDGASVLIRRNVVTGNGSDGIDIGNNFPGIDNAGTVIDNLANSNAVFGINADEGVTDGGGNQAQGNGDPAQCRNVVCRPHGFLFGTGNPGTSFSPMSANAKRASRFFLSFHPATVSQLRVYLDGRGATTGSQVLRAVIYTDASGQPGSPLIHSFQASIKAGAAPGWVTLALPFRLDLSAGYYWLGLHSGATSNVARFGWSSSPNTRRFNLDNYLDGPSSPFGSAASDEKRIAIHAIGFAHRGG